MDQAQLQQVESLSHALYQGTNQALRTEAQQQLLTLQSSIDFIPQCQFILDHSTQLYAQIVAISSLEALVTQFWINFTIPQKLSLHTYLLAYLGNHAETLQEYAVGHLTKLSARITKLGWFDSVEFREIVSEISKFFDAQSQAHHLVGMKLLNSLVDEMNTPLNGRSLTTHRKTAVSFRDHILLNIFTLAINQLKLLQSQLKSGMRTLQVDQMLNSLLQLATQCMAFDFIGANPEESSEDVGTLQVPSTWRNIIQDVGNLQLFFDLYSLCDPPLSQLALEAIVQLSSVRRSVFSSEQERTLFLQTLVTNLQRIMSSKHGLEHIENYHEFCRILGRLKASYQLSELVKLTNFSDFLELAGDFTIKSLANWQSCMNSIHYLLALWGRLVAALPYLRADVLDSQKQANLLKQINLSVVQSYIQTMLDSVEAVVNDSDIDDPLEDEGSLKEQMERLPVIARLQYDVIAQYLLNNFEQALGLYHQYMIVIYNNPAVNTSILANLPTNNTILSNINSFTNAQIVNQVAILEGRMTWLTYMIAAVIDNAATGADIRKNYTELMWDGRLSRCVFQLMTVLEYKLSYPAANALHAPVCEQIRYNRNLEIAILHYFKAFKKMYLLDSIGGTSINPSRMVVPGGSPAHPLLSLVLSDGSSMEKEGEVGNIYDAMRIGDMVTVMGVVVKKLCNNIKHYHNKDELLQETLDVFVDLITSYSSSKTLLNLDIVNYIIHNHNGSDFPFLAYDNDNKYRITFYSALSRLVFTSSEDLNNLFDVFMAPNLTILGQLLNTLNSKAADVKSHQVRIAIIGALRDLRGIATSAYNKRTYSLLFEALYPNYFPLFRRVAEIYYDDPTVMTALLKFVQEFVANKGQRIYFEYSSANGILLFREASAILCSYGSQVLSLPVRQNIYVEKYKGIRLLLNTLINTLSGNYVNFGVFSLYNDTALQNALDISLQICLQIPLSDILAYVKLSRAYFGYLEVLFRNHLDVLSGLDSSIFIQLVKTCQEGLQSSELAVNTSCANAVDHLASYLFLNQNREKPVVSLIRKHVFSDADLLNSLMSTLFNSLLFGTHSTHWAATRPILSLLLANESCYTHYVNYLISTQPPENQEKLKEEFGRLTADIQRSLETTNRDRFTQKLTVFRLNVRNFLTL